MNRPEIAVVAYRCAQELRADLRSYQGMFWKGTLSLKGFTIATVNMHFAFIFDLSCSYSGLVRCYLANSKIKEALHAAREAMKAMPQSAKALKLVGDVHASNSSGREKVYH